MLHRMSKIIIEDRKVIVKDMRGIQWGSAGIGDTPSFDFSRAFFLRDEPPHFLLIIPPK